MAVVVGVVIGISVPWDIFLNLVGLDVPDYENYPIAENFHITETYTGNISGYDQFVAIADSFDYVTKLNMSLNDYPSKMANYCSSAEFDLFAAKVQENEDNWGGLPFHNSHAKYQVHLEWRPSLNFSCILDDRYPEHIDVVINPEFYILNETHWDLTRYQASFENPHWYFNESNLSPDIYSHLIDPDGNFSFEHLLQFSDVYVMSMELEYSWGTSVWVNEWYTIEQMVIFSGDRDIIAIFVYDWSCIVT